MTLLPAVNAWVFLLRIYLKRMEKFNETVHAKPGNPSLPTSKKALGQLARHHTKGLKYGVEDFFKLPKKSRYQLSPGGMYFSFLGPVKRRLNIFVQKVGAKKTKQITAVFDRDIAWYFWKSDNRLVFSKDEGGNENFHLFAVNVDGSDLKKLTPFDGVRIDLLDDLEECPDEILVTMNKGNAHLFEPFRLNIVTGELTKLAENTNILEPLDGWMTDHDGRLLVANRLVGGTNTTLLYRESETAPFREVLTTDFREGVSPLFFDFEQPHVVYASSNIGRDKRAIVRLDLSTGMEIGEPIFSHPEVDVHQFGYSRLRKVPTSIYFTTDKRQVVHLDNVMEEIYGHLERLFPGYEVIISAYSKDESLFLIRTYSDRSLGAYYLFKTKDKSVEKITDVSPWINEEDMAPMRPVSYLTRDGLTVHGYLTLPIGQSAENLPVVVNPHGGPWVRDNWGYNPEVQLLASHGYGVFQMNYRGSTGYGRQFWEASFKEWGKKMQDDITDGVMWLVEEGIADPSRVAIYGGSYGGYAALAGVTFTPDLYRCAIDYVGVSNLFTFMNTIPPYWKPYLDMMYEMVGNPEADREQMYRASPVYHVDKIKCPLFVVQGANDPRVNIDESDQIVSELRKRGVDVPYMVKYDEGHGFHNEENRFEFYKVMLGFLGRYL